MNKHQEKISAEDQNRLNALKQLLDKSTTTESKLMRRDVDRFERQAGMTPREQVEDDAKHLDPYNKSLMHQRFSSVKRIYALRGSIFIEVDETESRKAAALEAFRVLGPLADEEAIKKYIADHTIKSVMMTIPRFIKNLRLVMMMVHIAPENFGEGDGGGEIKDIIDAARGAIRDARTYLRLHKNSMPEGIYNLLRNGDMQTDNKHEFVKYLGDGWEKASVTAAQHASALNIFK